MTKSKEKEKDFFDILFWDKIDPNKVTLEKTTGLLKRSSASEEFIGNEWWKKITYGFEPWPHDTQPTRYHFGGIDVSNGFVKIIADPAISYRDVMGSRPEKFRGLFAKEYWPITISVDMILVAKNKWGEKMLAITLRGANHDYNPSGFHVTTGGSMEIGKDEKPIDAALRETEEECGIKPRELSGILCRGITLIKDTQEIGVMFSATVNASAEEMLSRYHDNENEVLFVPTDKNNLEYLLTKFTYASSYDGIIGMLTIGEEFHGKHWRDGIMTKLYKRVGKSLSSVKNKELEKMDIEKFKKLSKKRGVLQFL